MPVKKICLCGLFSALITLCSWVSLPIGNQMFTLQTFGAFLALGLLGGKWGSVSISVYLLLGAIGLPVFSGFRGGVGMLLGPNGGFLWGFLAAGLAYWGAHALSKSKLLSMVFGLCVCYLFGSLWYHFLYLPEGGPGQIFALCVLPYLLPDGIKLGLALFLAKRLKPFV